MSKHVKALATQCVPVKQPFLISFFMLPFLCGGPFLWPRRHALCRIGTRGQVFNAQEESRTLQKFCCATEDDEVYSVDASRDPKIDPDCVDS